MSVYMSGKYPFHSELSLTVNYLNLRTKLRAIRQKLMFDWGMKMKKLELDSESAIVLQLIKQEDARNHKTANNLSQPLASFNKRVEF